MNKKIKVKRGRFKGKIFKLEGLIEDVCGDNSLAVLCCRGNYAAKNAFDIDKYTVYDEPFYYGKIGSLGYIISAKDLGIKIKEV